MIDMGRFKAVNDRYTHSVGDRVLKTVATLLCAQVRETDLPVRWAGDEFVILFGDAGLEQAQPMCARAAVTKVVFD